MKIGILTFHCSHNYGAMIQAYAMQEYLASRNCEVSIIDYRPDYIINSFIRDGSWLSCFSSGIGQTLKNLVFKFSLGSIMRKRFDNFDCFMNDRMRLCEFSIPEISKSFDSILIGSDQVWNPKITGGTFDDIFFGVPFECKVFSYAASCKPSELTSAQMGMMRDNLKSLYGIGVREQSLQQRLIETGVRNVCLNVDPTLLAGRSVYEKFDLSRPIKARYVLVYEINYHPEVESMAREYAAMLGRDVRVISLVGFIHRKRRSKDYDNVASPEKFVAYICNAECVFTTSFHGTALSIVFEKQFFAVRQGTSNDDRIQSLLCQLGLNQRFIDRSQVKSTMDIDYKAVDEKLEQIRKLSEDYINQIIDKS